MAEKWDKKTVVRYAQELKSPFEEQAGNGNKPRLAQLGDKLKQLLPQTKRV